MESQKMQEQVLLGLCNFCWYGVIDAEGCPESLEPDEVKDALNNCRSFEALEV